MDGDTAFAHRISLKALKYFSIISRYSTDSFAILRIAQDADASNMKIETKSAVGIFIFQRRFWFLFSCCPLFSRLLPLCLKAFITIPTAYRFMTFLHIFDVQHQISIKIVSLLFSSISQKRKIESSTGAPSIKVLTTFVLQLNYKRYLQNGQPHI